MVHFAILVNTKVNKGGDSLGEKLLLLTSSDNLF